MWVVIIKEAEYLSKTGTCAQTLEQREYTDDERVVLLHFFTNIDKNIYAATDAMPNCLWALLEGGYSRSQLSMRMRFLQIFEEMEQECEKGILSKEDLVTIKDMAEQIRQKSGINLSFFLEKAEKFMRKWAVQYGHDSLKDSDILRFAIENVSQAIIPFIEEARLGAYQEKSTRYVEFSREHLIVPPDLKKFEKEIKKWNDFLMTQYEESMPIVNAFIQKRLDPKSFKSEAALKRTVDAKTFDVVRYFLPATMLTSLGVVWPTREAERHISRLMSFPQEEVQSVGRLLLEEGMKVSPGLLRHVAINEYHVLQQDAITKIQKKLKLKKTECSAGRNNDAVKLVSISSHMDARIAASILFRNDSGTNEYKEYVKCCIDDPTLVTKTFDAFIQNRGKFDSFPMASETGNMLFEICVDFGAYRDIKRHRRNLFLHAPFTALQGYEFPEYVNEEPELIDVKNKMALCNEKTIALHTKIVKKKKHCSMYIIMFAHKQRMLWQMDPRQFAYVVELRTTPAGHHSYRTICQQMFRVAEPHMPEFCKHIRVDMSSGEEGRKKQEEKTVEKIKALGGNVERVS
ncbi:hypothetical protein HOL21_04180 [Candidatus Woesearchaeota archaeon]|jgi:thymidylate synthase ThyX|nr:hypothetical protein [Candidatus Woesearchaeota archaeon]MBT5397384.1 hypothetical protein [Candidatus Woesearchaeota archaeon]MBT5924533.1 hypothetical protein [Candidatus Woesearchaeota archaeon]MBT6367770.1 hypothetical protein [Candidatus Woesearchaeota archaeon]MBT7762784.1 hypothetical protein [Candidatus Woesearchaeota archaeon]